MRVKSCYNCIHGKVCGVLNSLTNTIVNSTQLHPANGELFKCLNENLALLCHNYADKLDFTYASKR